MKTRQWLVYAGLCLATLAAYSNSFGTGLVFDCHFLVLQDQRVRAATGNNLNLILSHTYWWPLFESGLYRPFTTLTYLFNYAVLDNGENSAGYHWFNFLLHVGNVLLVYALGRRLIGGFWPPIFAATLWGVHPVLTESVTNIVGRADLIAGAAVLGGLLIYLRSTETTSTLRLWWLIGLSATTTIGVFAKESAVVVLAVVTLYELTWWTQRKNVQGLVGAFLAMLPPLQVMLYQRAAVLATARPASFPFLDNPMVAAGFWTGKLTAIVVMARYIDLLVWPATLSSDYSWQQIPLARGSAADCQACAIVLVVASAAITSYRWNRTVFFLSSLALLALLPVSNLLFPIGTIMAERFLYLPAIALVFCLVIAAFEVNRRAAPLVLGLIACGFAARTWVRNRDWQDDLTLARASVKSAPASFKPHKGLATALYGTHAGIDQVIAEAEAGLTPLNGLPDQLNDADSYSRAADYYAEKHDDGRSLELLLRCEAILRAQNAAQLDPARYAEVQLRISNVRFRLGNVR